MPGGRRELAMRRGWGLGSNGNWLAACMVKENPSQDVRRPVRVPNRCVVIIRSYFPTCYIHETLGLSMAVGSRVREGGEGDVLVCCSL